MPSQNENRTVQGSQLSSRKPYQAPKLRCYGDVGAITQTSGNKSATSDNSTNQGMDKTA